MNAVTSSGKKCGLSGLSAIQDGHLTLGPLRAAGVNTGDGWWGYVISDDVRYREIAEIGYAYVAGTEGSLRAGFQQRK